MMRKYRAISRVGAVVLSAVLVSAGVVPTAQAAPVVPTDDALTTSTQPLGVDTSPALSLQEGSSDPLGLKHWDPFDLKPPRYIQVKAVENTMPLVRDNSQGGWCVRDPLASDFQRCRIWSASMGRFIPIHFKPASNGSHAVLVLLDGASARNNFNRWINRGGAARITANTNINVIAPIGGGASWYVDWQYPGCSLTEPQDSKQMWETFLTKELTNWGAWAAGINRQLYSMAGFSMGGGSAIDLAERHPDMVRQALSFSGVLSYSVPFVQPVTSISGDFSPCVWGPFGTILNPARYEHDPTLNVRKLRGVDVYASAYTGIPRKNLSPAATRAELKNGIWEVGARAMLHMFEIAAKLADVPVTINYLGDGSHQYEAAQRELRSQMPRILRVMGDREKELQRATSAPAKPTPTPSATKRPSTPGPTTTSPKPAPTPAKPTTPAPVKPATSAPGASGADANWFSAR